MKKFVVLLFLFFIANLSFSNTTNTLVEWTFDDGTLIASPVVVGIATNAGPHLGGSDTNGNPYLNLEARVAEGATLSTPSTGALTFGRTGGALTGGGNIYLGPMNVPQGSNELTDTNYVYAVSNNTVRFTLKVNHVDFSTTISKSTMFGIRLFDKKSDHWVGFCIQDRNGPGLELNVQSDTGSLTGITSGGTGNNNLGGTPAYPWARVKVIAPNGEWATADDNTFVFEMDLSSGLWTLDMNGVEEAVGTFSTANIKGFDRYGIVFNNFDTGDYLEIDEMKIESIVSTEQVLEAVSGYYYTVQDGGNLVFGSPTGYPAHTNGNMAVVFNDVADTTSWNYTNNPISYAASETLIVPSTTTLVGTNATKVSSIWTANTTGTVEYWDNVGGRLISGTSVFTAPGNNDNLKLKSANTELVIDSDVTLASISGEALGGTTLSITNAGNLVVRGSSPLVATPGKTGSGLTYMDSQIQAGAYGTGPGTHSMIVNVDGAAASLDADRISLGHSRAGGILNVQNGASVNIANNFYVGYDNYFYGTGVVNQASGSITADEVSVGMRGIGELNISGGVFDASTFLRVSSSVTSDGGVNGSGTINLTGGTLNATTGTPTYVGYNQIDAGTDVKGNNPDTKHTGNLNVSGGTFNALDNIDIGRTSDGVLTISGSGAVNITNANLSLGHQVSGSGTLNMNGGTLDIVISEGYTNTVPSLNVAGWSGGTGTVAMTDGIINIDGNFYINNINPNDGTLSPTVATVVQSGGTINSKGGEVRIGGNGEGNYTIGGGESVATLWVNPTSAITNNAGAANASIVLSRNPVNSSFTITNNALVHANSIVLEPSEFNAQADGAQAVLNLDGGTLLIDGYTTNGVQVANDGQINISNGALIWAGDRAGFVASNLVSFINLTGGANEVPAGSYNPVFTNQAGSAILYAESYNSSNKVYSAEMREGSNYTRFVSVLSDPPSAFDLWAANLGLSGADGDGDGDGMSNLLEYALGTDPSVSDSGTVSGGRNGSNILFTHAKREGTDHGLTYIVQTNANMKFPVWGDISTVSASEAAAAVTHTIDTEIETEDLLFIRLKVETE